MRYGKILVLVLLAGAFVPASSLFAFSLDLPGVGSTGFSFTETAIYRYYTDDDYVNDVEDGKAAEFLNRLNLRVSNGDYLIGLRFDVDINTPREEEYRLEKKFFQVNKKSFTLEVGDYYYSLGRGMVLNVVKSFEDEGAEYQIEQTILGGEITLRSDRLTGTILGGVLDNEDLDISDTIGGGALTWNALDSTIVGVNLIGVKFDDEDPRPATRNYDQGAIGSISLQFPTIGEFASFYVEYAAMGLQARDEEDENLNGWGLYAESSLFFGDWTILLEGRRYQDFVFPYHNPPLLEPEELGILAEQFDMDTIDTTGFRIRVDYSIPETNTILFGVTSYTDDSPEDAPTFGSYYRYITESYGGLDSRFGERDIHILAAVGYRYENGSELSPSDYRGYTPHAFLTVKVPVSDRHAFEVVANWKKFTEDSTIGFGEYSFSRQEYSLTYLWSPMLIVTFTHEFYDDVRSQFGNDQTDYDSINITYRPIEDLYVKLFYGATPGGVKCSSGVCKTFPPFEGARAEVVFRF